MKKYHRQYSIQSTLESFLDEECATAAHKAINKFKSFLTNSQYETSDVAQSFFEKVHGYEKKLTPALCFTMMKNMILDLISHQNIRIQYTRDQLEQNTSDSNNSYKYADNKIDYDNLSREDKLVLMYKSNFITLEELKEAGINSRKLRNKLKHFKARGYCV